MIELDKSQMDAVNNLKNGSILVGSVGTGKSRTSLTYFYIKVCNGMLKINDKGFNSPMKNPKTLYIITTAKKRESKEWLDECFPFGINDVIVDSWNNIKKYTNVYGAFFIFDEQRVVGSGAWVKAFLNITRKNEWILLSATPGDKWSDYIPVFIANGFYKNKTEFNSMHVIFNRFAKYPMVDRYVNTKLLDKHRKDILVNIDYKKHTISHKNYIPVEYDKKDYLKIWKDRWDIYDNEPIEETSKLCYLMRKVVNSDITRIHKCVDLINLHKKVIIFYNFDYELDMLRKMCIDNKYEYSEWNGQKHEEVPTSSEWVYLVNYAAGAEGWNCITTNTIIFYSQNYSYRMMIQAAGRIDRRNTKYTDLYYYILKSVAPIDIAISRALSQKKKFNEKSFIGS